jgi:hypothetical protein
MASRIQQYLNECRKYDGIEPYETSISFIAADALAESDRTAELLDNTPQALYGRYEFRDGAAHALATVFGLDMDYARQIMRTHKAWADYEEANK